jgi:hypothetical protein
MKMILIDDEVKFNGFHLLESSTSNRLTHLSFLIKGHFYSKILGDKWLVLNSDATISCSLYFKYINLILWA